MAANDIFETWLNDKLCKFLNNNNNTDSNDTNIFLNYIISLLNEEEDTSLNDKKSSIESILHDLNPDKPDNEAKLLTEEIIDKWSAIKDSASETNAINSQAITNSTDKSNEIEDPGDAILNMIKEHKNQVVETRRAKKKSESDEFYNASNHIYYSNSDDDDNDENNGKSNLFENRNAQVVLEREKQNREKLHDNYLKQKERIKKDQLDQKQREEERKKRAKQRAAKVERKA